MLSRRLSENVHLRRYPHSSSLRRTDKYASFLRISDALHLNIFQQPPKMGFSDRLLGGCGKMGVSNRRPAARPDARLEAETVGFEDAEHKLLHLKNILETL